MWQGMISCWTFITSAKICCDVAQIVNFSHSIFVGVLRDHLPVAIRMMLQSENEMNKTQWPLTSFQFSRWGLELSLEISITITVLLLVTLTEPLLDQHMLVFTGKCFLSTGEK